MGRIKKLACEVCNEPKSEAHHYKGYEGDAKFDVQWLCPGHHRQVELGKLVLESNQKGDDGE